jgi:hypothetical protein
VQYARETTKMSKNEEMHEYVSQQISQLTPYIHNRDTVAKFSMEFTMINGKVCNAAIETSSIICHICKPNISQMNNLEKFKKITVDQTNYRYFYNVNLRIMV